MPSPHATAKALAERIVDALARDSNAVVGLRVWSRRGLDQHRSDWTRADAISVIQAELDREAQDGN